MFCAVCFAIPVCRCWMEEAAEDEEVDWNDNAIDRNGCPCIGDPQPQEKFQKDDVEGVVDDMAEGKACAVLDGGPCAESEPVG